MSSPHPLSCSFFFWIHDCRLKQLKSEKTHSWKGSGAMEASFGNSEFKTLWTAKMGMFTTCNLMCGFGPFAKVQIQAFQHIRGSQWNFIPVGCGRLVGPCGEVSGG